MDWKARCVHKRGETVIDENLAFSPCEALVWVLALGMKETK